MAGSSESPWLLLAPGSSRSALAAAGKAARRRAPRSSHAAWEHGAQRPDPIATLREGDEARVVELLPVRYGRMAQNAFTFFRGAAAVMARDLATLPVTGIRTQACGDCHLLNFGAFATPERNLVFDVNDFDETLPGAWEWDIKRLTASVAIAGRHLGFDRPQRRGAILRCARAYRENLGVYAGAGVLEVWYARLDEQALIGLVRTAQARRQYAGMAARARSQTNAHAFPRLTQEMEGHPRFSDEPRVTYHPADTAAFAHAVAEMFARYRDSIPDDRKALFDRFRLVDAAYHVVGVGSVGTRCLVALFLSGNDDPLILQAKEALASVLEPYAGPSMAATHGERVVFGQHLMQAASDIFLGWTRGPDGRDYYVRQLRDMKTSANVDRMTRAELGDYAAFCGWSLARAHAKASGVAVAIAGYLGRKETFDAALASFAEAYADQNERDYARLLEAIKAKAIAIVPPDA